MSPPITDKTERGFLHGRVSPKIFDVFEKKSRAQGYSRSEVMRMLVVAFVNGKIKIPDKSEPEVL